jgi:hypothetical protein
MKGNSHTENYVIKKTPFLTTKITCSVEKAGKKCRKILPTNPEAHIKPIKILYSFVVFFLYP